MEESEPGNRFRIRGVCLVTKTIHHIAALRLEDIDCHLTFFDSVHGLPDRGGGDSHRVERVCFVELALGLLQLIGAKPVPGFEKIEITSEPPCAGDCRAARCYAADAHSISFLNVEDQSHAVLSADVAYVDDVVGDFGAGESLSRVS